MPTRCTEAATCSCIRNSCLPSLYRANRAGSYVWAAAGPTDIVPIAKIAKARMRIRTSLWIVLPFRPRPDFQMKETSP